ncbi:DUF2147 domain-containing protein [Sphingorhabdus sp. 109]|jgi:uncharacterized protein (DUF2147 family)|uniref:DUF2147 domain-containing protein n=1 Tax=Sphingorhabdus sp. 109 TaxID=2653173 RepID=UPI0012EF4E15|nr:DUF2147 domain-containing protein [Sphingorhabdus sp. 109]VWX61245.1 conserved exported hypothetical protein [Sphingorhabdus sp. 109]
MFIFTSDRPAIGLISAAMIFASPALAAEPITGDWITEDRDAIIRISRCGATVCGRIHKYLVTPPDGAGQKDIYNPDRKLRNRKVLGIAILTGLRPDGDIWRGKVYDPKSGRTYRSEISLDATNRLKMKGCVAFICQSQIWTRAR